MFIGGSPSSTAGGIRTTTLCICLIGIVSKLKGKSDIVIFKRRITESDSINSYVILFVGFIIIGIGGFILSFSTFNTTASVFTNAIFLSSSAFGTTGLSVMNIDQVDPFGKIYLMVLMFIGQFSISSTILSFNRKKLKSNRFRYLTENVKIG
jgi:Trk-type K+ transport system membrane component